MKEQKKERQKLNHGTLRRKKSSDREREREREREVERETGQKGRKKLRKKSLNCKRKKRKEKKRKEKTRRQENGAQATTSKIQSIFLFQLPLPYFLDIYLKQNQANPMLIPQSNAHHFLFRVFVFKSKL